MDPSFIPIETVPSKTPFGLDQLRRSYKTALDAAAAIAAAPNVGDADEVFPNMFLMPISTPESAESATRIDLVYMGCFGGAEGSPVLPDQKHDSDDAVQSASSSRSNAGVVLSSPITIQYFAPSNSLSYVSFGGPGSDHPPDPSTEIKIITIQTGEINLTGDSIPAFVNSFFTPQIIETVKADEIVPGQFWMNNARKITTMVPYLFNLSPGAYLNMVAVGTGYTVGNTLTCSSGGESASITVDSLGVSNSIIRFHVGANTFTVAHTNVACTGGSGTGAACDVIIVT